jgi:anti-sigma factor RsiW
MMCSAKNGRQVNAYHDGALPPEDARRLEAHLAQCPVCAQELKELRSLSRFLRDARLPDVPDKVVKRLHGTVAFSSTAREDVVVTLAMRLTAAAAAILIVCAAWIWGVSRASEPHAAANTWELAAVTLRAYTTTDTQQIAEWIVDDLSLENSHD